MKKNKSYRRPAVCFEAQLKEEWNKMTYKDDMFYYMGAPGSDEFYVAHESANLGGSYRYQWAIVDDNEKVIGVIDYLYNARTKITSQFGLYSFDKGNPIIGHALKECLDEIVYKLKSHRVEWRMISGNPVQKHYDKYCEMYNGKKHILKDACMDLYGNYHDDVIYELIDPWKVDIGKKHDGRPDSMRMFSIKPSTMHINEEDGHHVGNMNGVDDPPNLFANISTAYSDLLKDRPVACGLHQPVEPTINGSNKEEPEYEPLNIETKLECADPNDFLDDSDWDFSESLNIATKCLTLFSKWILDNKIDDDWEAMKVAASKLLVAINDATNNGAETKYDFDVYELVSSIRAKALATIENFIKDYYQPDYTEAEIGKQEGYHDKATGEFCIRPVTGGNEEYNIPNSVLVKDMYSNPKVVGALICIITLGIIPSEPRMNIDGSEDTNTTYSRSRYSRTIYITHSALIDITRNISLCNSRKFKSARITDYVKCLMHGVASNIDDVKYDIIKTEGNVTDDYMISIVFKKD